MFLGSETGERVWRGAMFFAASVLVFVSLVLVNGCSSGSQEEIPLIAFSDVDVNVESETGWFGGRYARFKVTGSVANNTKTAVNRDNLPRIKWYDSEEKASITQQKLGVGESCDFTYSGKVTIEGESAPELLFEGPVNWSGLEEAQSALNEGVAGVYADFKAADEEKARAREADAAEKQRVADEIDSCVGKSANEARSVASDLGFNVTLRDKNGKDVTSYADEELGIAAIGSAIVTSYEYGTFIHSNLYFTLDFEFTDEEVASDGNSEQTEEFGEGLSEEAASDENSSEMLAEPFPVDIAQRAAIVSLTNATASDVYADDGNSHDTSKYHRFSDRSGEYLDLVRDGEWTVKKDNTWHVSGMELVNNYGTEMIASCDVSFDGTNYVVSNLSGMLGRSGAGTSLEQYEQYYDSSWTYLTVTPDLLG